MQEKMYVDLEIKRNENSCFSFKLPKPPNNTKFILSALALEGDLNDVAFFHASAISDRLYIDFYDHELEHLPWTRCSYELYNGFISENNIVMSGVIDIIE